MVPARYFDLACLARPTDNCRPLADFVMGRPVGTGWFFCLLGC